MTPNGKKYAFCFEGPPRHFGGQGVRSKARAGSRQKALDRINAAITIFEPGFSFDSLGVKRPRKRVKLYGQGELSRSILHALRHAGEPIGIDAIVGSLLLAQGHEAEQRPP